MRSVNLDSALFNMVALMFAVVKTGSKQYKVSVGDIIEVEKLAGEPGSSITLSDVLFKAEGSSVSRPGGVTAEIIAQRKADKVIIFKKKRRHNYRRKNGHRQQLTALKITSIG